MADGSVKIEMVADDSDIKKKIDDTEEGFDELGKKQKETQKETEKTTTKFEELANTIDKQEKELRDLRGAYTEAIVNFGKGSAEAKELKDKMSSLNSELSKNKETFSKAKGESEKLSEALDQTEKSFDATDVALGNFLADGLTNLIGKVGEAIGAMIALADETREYREDMAKLDTAFTTAGHSTETASQAYDSFYRILGESDRSVEAVNHLAELTKNEKEIAQWSTIAAGVTAKFGDSLPIEGLTEAANETAKVGAVTGPLADALNWAGISEDEFNKKLAKCSTEQERASLITSTLNAEYEAAANEYNELTASTQAARDATNQMEKAQATLGETIEPMTTAWTELKAKGMEALQPVIEGVVNSLSGLMGWLQEHPAVLTTVIGALGGLAVALTAITAATVAQTIAQWAQNAAWLANPVTWIVVGIAAAVGALVGAFIYLWNNCEGFREFWTNLWEKVKEVLTPVIEWLKDAFAKAWEAIKAVWDYVKPYFTMIWENIKLVFSVVKEWLGGMFKTAWEAIKAVWNVVGAYFKAVWETIKGIFAVVKNVLSGNWKEAWEAIKKICGAWGDYFKAIWDGIKNVFSAVKSWFGNTFKAAWEAIKGVFSNVREFFSGVIDKIVGVFSNIKSKFLNVGSNIVKGIWDGISKGYEWIKNKIKSWVGNVVDFCKKLLGIKSPSRVFRDEIGKMIAAGIEVGIEENADKPSEALKGVFASMSKVLKEEQKDTIDTVKEYNSDIIDLEKEKNKKLKELEEKFIEDKKKKDADKKALEKKYTEDIETINEQHAEKVASIQDNIKKTISSKMQEIVTLEEKYKEDTKKVFDDLANSIEDAQANYESQLASRTASIASSLGLWDEATRNKTTGLELKRNLQSQVRMLEDYNEAIAKLEERNVSTAFINSLKEMGVGATGEIEALVKLSDSQLNSYVDLWEKKNELARTAATEELEPLKAETEAKIEELTNTALDKYAELRAKYTEQGSLLMAELKQAMIEAGQGGYEEIIGQIDDYTEAGEDLMSGVIAGIVDKSPEVANAVKSAVRRAIDAAKAAAGIASPSKVMKKEVGYNLADGVSVGWSDKVADLKNKMAADMQGITARIKTAVSLENARMSQGVGVRDTGFSEVAQAVGMQTAGINSLASEYRRGSSTQVTVPLVIDGREFGRAVVDLGNAETVRTGASLSFA